MNHRPKVIISAAMLLSTLIGCDELDLNGRLGNGEFEYQCIGPGDASCYGTRTILGFDLDRDILPVAVGADFGLTFDSDKEASLAATAPTLVSESSGVFSFEEAATVDFYALSKEGKLLDFAPLSSQTATRIAIFEDADEVQAFSARRQYDVEVAAAPMNGNTVLSGGRSY